MLDDIDAISNQPVVLDNGTGIVKAGLAGDDLPKCVFPSYVGRPKHEKVMAGALDGDYFVGSKAEVHRGILSVKYPMEHGVVTDWGDMEKVWQHVYNELKVSPEEHPILLTEAPLNPRKNREKAAEILFENFGVPAMFVTMQAVLSLYASGRTTGVVLDSGDGCTHAVPIYEGFAMPHGVTRVDIAGRDVTERLQLLLRKAGYNLHTSAEKEIVKDVKEKACYVAANPQKEEAMELEKNIETYSYRLPDGHSVEIAPERFRAPEVLFNPSLIGKEYSGIHDCLVESIRKVDLDLRKALYSQIVLSGGSTLFTGFGERLLNELRKHSDVAKDVKIRIAAPPERKYSTWMGGSILASLATFKKMWVSADEYKEDGPNIVHKKTF